MPGADAAIEDLEARLRRVPRDRYPVQHATAQFHLGVALTDDGRLEEARRALEVAAELFDPERLPVEHAKATNALGAVLRLTGAQDQAMPVFARAAAAFESAGLTAEHGAARFNLGLVQRESSDAAAAVASLEHARRLLEDAALPARAAAAARELGAARLTLGDLDLARRALERSVALAERAGDQAGLGASANALGLVHLHAGRPDEAVEALRSAAAATPRAVRPEAYAMVKGNLAIAHEQRDDALRARIAARQALGVAGRPEPVAEQAAAVLERLGDGPGDLLRLLRGEAQEAWPALVREEFARWVEADSSERLAEAGAWIEGQLEAGNGAVELAEAWVGGLLELPPGPLERMIRSTLEALARRDEATRERFRSQIDQAMARFHVPQLMRLREEFRRLAEEVEGRRTWS